MHLGTGKSMHHWRQFVDNLETLRRALSLRSPPDNWTVGLDGCQICWMMGRAIPVFGILIALSQTATAGVPLFGHVSCTVVRFYVAKYSEAAAEKWARGHGYSDSEIETARRCLHSADVQTATAPTNSPTHLTEQYRAPHEQADRDQEASHAVSDQGQRGDAEQANEENQSGVRAFIRPKDVGRSTGDVRHETKDLASPDKKITTPRPRYAGAMHRAGIGHVSWIKRLWDHLTRHRQFSFAVLRFSGGRR